MHLGCCHVVWGLQQVGFVGAYGAGRDKVDPCAHMVGVQVPAMAVGEVVVHGCHNGHEVSGYWMAMVVGGAWAHSLQSGTRPHAGVLRAWAAGWGRGK